MSEFDHPTGPVVEVGMSQWGQLQNEGILETDGLSACTGVCIYDPQEKLAFLWHFPVQDAGPPPDLDEMLEVAQASIKDPSQVRIWVGGNSFEGATEAGAARPDVDVQHTRDIVIDRLTEVFSGGGVRLTIQWLEEAGSINYAIDVATGEEEIEVEEEELYHEEWYDEEI